MRNNMLVRVTVLLYFLFLISRQWFVVCKIGQVNEMMLSSKYICEKSKMKIFKAVSEIQCVHKCTKAKKCQLLNYRVDAESENCEIYELPQNHNSCRASIDRNWKVLFIETKCNSKQNNYCFPCQCASTCLSKEAECYCDVVPRPSILISFEEVMNETLIKYSKGMDMNSKDVVALENNASVGTSEGRYGNVLRLNGIDAGANAGYFMAHTINNPNRDKVTVTFWIRVLSPQPTTQTVFGSGKGGSNTGTLMRLSNNSQTIYAELVMSTKSASLSYFAGDTLQSWTHLALVDYKPGSVGIKLYVNGVLAASAHGSSTETVDGSQSPNLIFGASDELFPLTGEYYNIHIDDFAVWLAELSEDQIAQIMTQDYKICE